mmetsp:Transcript_4844/g.10246  ORF Transcript_4844/g.10246 Transcript_4844/m.10246 type:complete len:91 (-) Transcript_4844:43-315(-)
MLQAPIDRSVIHNSLRAQYATIVESPFNNINPPTGDTTVHSDNNDPNDFPMEFDTTQKIVHHHLIYLPLTSMIWKKKENPFPSRLPALVF